MLANKSLPESGALFQRNHSKHSTKAVQLLSKRLSLDSIKTVQKIILFLKKKKDQIRKQLFVKANNLSITSVDIYNVEITDPKTREYLQRSINLAIEISAKS